MLHRFQLVLACFLVTAASGTILLWLLLLALSYGPWSGLMPWVAAGIVLYGWVLVAIAAAIGVPGILWASYLASRTSPGLGQVAKLTKRIGTGTLALGLAAAAAVLVVEHTRPKNPFDGCVSYRTEAASGATEAPGAKPAIDCPAK